MEIIEDSQPPAQILTSRPHTDEMGGLPAFDILPHSDLWPKHARDVTGSGGIETGRRSGVF